MREIRFGLYVSLALLAIPFHPLHAGAGANPGGALPVVGDAHNKLIPVAVKGYDGEVARVLKFDLEVMGCKIVPEVDSAYLLAGGNLNSVNGILKDAAGNFRFNKRYNGGNLRQQAHALSNDVIKAITGRNGIAQTRILYKMKTGPRAYEVFVSDYDGHRPVALTSDNTLTESPLWAPGNGEVFYTSWMKIGGVENTTVIRHKMKTGKRTVFSRFKGLNTGGDLSPQGMVAMVLSRGINPDVWVAPMGWEFLKDIKGKQLKQMCRTREAESGPAWSPDGKWVLFSMSQGGRTDIYRITSAGGGTPERLTNGPGINIGGSYSPDGSRIVFESDRSGGQQLYVMNADGSNQRRISHGGGRYATPEWSPRGDLIAFTKMSGDFKIAVMTPNGDNERILTNGWQDEQPTWSPNGRVLQFFRTTPGRQGTSQVWQVDLTGVNERRIPTPLSGSDPAWGPLLP